MKVRMNKYRAGLGAALVLGLVCAIATPGFAQRGDADTARARAIQECMAVQNQYPDQAWGSSELYHYRACMAEHGQPE